MAEEEEEEEEQQQAAISSNGGEDFKCNICLNIASDAVVTLCGHLFCWPCLYTWLHFHSRYKECPVCKGAASETKLIPIYSWGAKDAMSLQRPNNNNNNIPPRPPARRVEIDRHRRQRYHAERERRNIEPAEINNNNPTSPGFNEASSRDAHPVNTNGNINFNLMGRETRASWLERLRAMREERLVWPVAFVHGLTSRELLQQRRHATDIALSPRLTNANLGHDSPMHDANHDIAAAAGYCQSGLTQQGALQRRSLSLGCMNHHHHHHHQMLSLPSSSEAGNASHTTQYLSTMSSILSSMEVFAKALELSSASSMKKSSSLTSTSVSATQPPPAPSHHLRVFNTPDEEQALWQSSMRGLLTQMERLMVQLQSIQPIKNSIHANPSSSTDHQASYNHWINTANTITPTTTTNNNNNLMPPHHHHHHHHHHLDGSLTDRSRVINPLLDRGFVGQGEVNSNIINGNNVLGLSPRSGHFDPNLNMARVASAAAHCNRSAMFSLPSEGNSRELEQPSTGSKSRKRWDVTRMSR